MTEQNNNKNTDTDTDDKTVNVIESEATDANESTAEKSSTEAPATEKKEPVVSNEVITRIFVTLLFAFIGWLSLWVFGVVVLVQFGFLLITGQLNKNLKAFNGELGDFLADIIKYVSFQTNDKPFPFQSWSYGETTESDQSEAKSS
ncbi:DUF4389 domain-containing protein [Marinicella rhabdoformis]|uniref:DUF4389 domain-containing protein n=1 Tax=Marinicella rhabdoformis TaxID=2580566 RepID=UPI0012AEB5A4|nr:DUF4389 domain-containing protein [Marinicella rhabdoformis]